MGERVESGMMMKTACVAGLLVGAGVAVGGCASSEAGGSRGGEGGGGGGGGDDVAYVERGLNAAERSVGTGAREREAQGGRSGDGRPVALVAGEPVDGRAFRARLTELAGAQVFEEMVLDAGVARLARERGVRVTEPMLEAEALLMAEAVGRAAGADARDSSAAVLERVRRERGLGPERFAALLRRSALLRALVQRDVTITEEQVRRAHEMRYGPTYRVRLITTGTAAEAASAVRRHAGGASFGELAAELSTDASAARGGLIEPINPADPTWPRAVRDAVVMLDPGEVSDPIAIDNGFAVLRLEEGPITPPFRPELERVRSSLERDARLEQERLLMARLARRLATETESTVLDDSLRWATGR